MIVVQPVVETPVRRLRALAGGPARTVELPAAERGARPGRDRCGGDGDRRLQRHRSRHRRRPRRPPAAAGRPPPGAPARPAHHGRALRLRRAESGGHRHRGGAATGLLQRTGGAERLARGHRRRRPGLLRPRPFAAGRAGRRHRPVGRRHRAGGRPGDRAARRGAAPPGRRRRAVPGRPPPGGRRPPVRSQAGPVTAALARALDLPPPGAAPEAWQGLSPRRQEHRPGGGGQASGAGDPSGGVETAIVPWAMAHSVSAPAASTVETSQRHATRVRPARTTRARARSRTPPAGRR